LWVALGRAAEQPVRVRPYLQESTGRHTRGKHRPEYNGVAFPRRPYKSTNTNWRLTMSHPRLARLGSLIAITAASALSAVPFGLAADGHHGRGVHGSTASSSACPRPPDTRPPLPSSNRVQPPPASEQLGLSSNPKPGRLPADRNGRGVLSPTRSSRRDLPGETSRQLTETHLDTSKEPHDPHAPRAPARRQPILRG
jgi:hypothetical protein